VIKLSGADTTRQVRRKAVSSWTCLREPFAIATLNRSIEPNLLLHYLDISDYKGQAWIFRVWWINLDRKFEALKLLSRLWWDWARRLPVVAVLPSQLTLRQRLKRKAVAGCQPQRGQGSPQLSGLVGLSKRVRPRPKRLRQPRRGLLAASL
jgi:hypothetical protein